MTATTNPSTFTSAAPAAPTGEPPRDAVLDFEAVQSFLSRVVTDLGGAMIGLVCALGDRLGLFRALAAAGPCTSEQLARHCRMHERPIREWLCAVASAGYVVYDPARASYRLPPEHVLASALLQPLSALRPEAVRTVPVGRKQGSSCASSIRTARPSGPQRIVWLPCARP